MVVKPSRLRGQRRRQIVNTLAVWSRQYRTRPRSSLSRSDGRVVVAFALGPPVLVVLGVRDLLGINGAMPVWERLSGVFTIVFGLLLLYLDWSYLQRPVREEDDD